MAKNCIEITSCEYVSDIEKLVEKNLIPKDLEICLKVFVGAYLKNKPSFELTIDLLALVRKYLDIDVVLISPLGKETLELKIYIPGTKDKGDREDCLCLKLAPKDNNQADSISDGQLLSLAEIIK